MKNQAPIVVFDSGFGGISVLKRLVSIMPNEDFLYYGDSANAPYGPRTQEEVCKLTLSAIGFLADRNPKAVVIACNTATAASLDALEAKFPHIPIIGIRPAVQQAASASHRVLVLATQGTIQSTPFQNQLKHLVTDAEIICTPAPGIVTYVEGTMKDREGILNYLRNLFLPLKDKHVDSVVLGCTHFPFAADVIQEALGYPVSFFDASWDVAKTTCQILEQSGNRNPQTEPGCVTFMSSSDDPQLMDFARFLFNKNLPTDEYATAGAI